MTLKKVELGKKGREAIEQSIRLMLFTPKGAIPMRPEFGNALLNRLDEPVDLAQAAQDIADALSQDPRIKARRVVIDEKELQNGSVSIKLDIEYQGDEKDLFEVEQTIEANNNLKTIQLIEPLQNQIFNNETTVRFSWQAPTFIEQFTLEVATDKQFVNVIYISSTTQRHQVVNLSRASTYYWRVKSVFAIQGKFFEVFSETFSFGFTIDFFISAPNYLELNQNTSLDFIAELDLRQYQNDRSVFVSVENFSELNRDGVVILPTTYSKTGAQIHQLPFEIYASITAPVQLNKINLRVSGNVDKERRIDIAVNPQVVRNISEILVDLPAGIAPLYLFEFGDNVTADANGCASEVAPISSLFSQSVVQADPNLRPRIIEFSANFNGQKCLSFRWNNQYTRLRHTSNALFGDFLVAVVFQTSDIFRNTDIAGMAQGSMSPPFFVEYRTSQMIWAMECRINGQPTAVISENRPQLALLRYQNLNFSGFEIGSAFNGARAGSPATAFTIAGIYMFSYPTGQSFSNQSEFVGRLEDYCMEKFGIGI